MEIPFLPFLSRKQLSFQEATGFSIQIRTISSTAGTISVRGFSKEGTFNFVHSADGTRAEKLEVFAIPDIPIMLTIDEAGTTLAAGSCYATAALFLNNTKVYNLTAGYIHKNKGLTWPMTASEPNMTENELVTIITSADPAAGAEITLTLPNVRLFKLKGLKFQLVCAAVAASRRVHVVISYSGNKVFNLFGSTDQIISETKDYWCYPGGDLTAATAGDNIYIPMPPDLILEGGMIITTETLNLNAGDNFGVMTIFGQQQVMRNV